MLYKLQIIYHQICIFYFMENKAEAKKVICDWEDIGHDLNRSRTKFRNNSTGMMNFIS